MKVGSGHHSAMERTTTANDPTPTRSGVCVRCTTVPAVAEV